MTGVDLALAACAAILLVAVVGERVFEDTGIPDVLWLLLVGIVLGPLTGFVRAEDLAVVAPVFGALTIVVVMFGGGLQIRAAEVAQAGPRAAALAVLGFAATVGVVTPLSMAAAAGGLLPASWTWSHGVLLGAILGGSSSVVVMPSLDKARIDPVVASTVGLESALTDVLCVVVASAMIDVLGGGGADPLGALVRSFGVATAIGVAVGLAAHALLDRLAQASNAYALTLATLLLVYVVTDVTGGSAALAILVASMVVANAPGLAGGGSSFARVSLARGVTGVHTQVLFLVKSFFFTFIGASLVPTVALGLLGLGLGVALLLARVPAVALTTLGSGWSRPTRALVVTALPRGMAAGVLSGMPAAAGIPGTEELPTLVFPTVIATIVLFAALFPMARARIVDAAPEAPP